jgi:hypothetical protein
MVDGNRHRRHRRQLSASSFCALHSIRHSCCTEILAQRMGAPHEEFPRFHCVHGKVAYSPTSSQALVFLCAPDREAKSPMHRSSAGLDWGQREVGVREVGGKEGGRRAFMARRDYVIERWGVVKGLMNGRRRNGGWSGMIIENPAE